MEPRGGGLVRASRTRFVWDGDVLAHEIREAASAAGDPVVEERTYLFEDDLEPVGHRAGSAWYHYLNDPVGTPRHVADDTGKATEIRRSAWGQAEAVLSPDGDTPVASLGQLDDVETGLTYNRWRYFDSAAGRFASPDPIRLNGGPNFYSVVRNPVTWIDPFGLAGGRRGNDTTRDQLDAVRDGYLKANPSHKHIAGGRDCTTGKKLPEKYIPPWNGGRKGGSYPDLSFQAPDGTLHHVNTVDVAPTRASGMSRREEENAARIFETLQPGDSLTLIPKAT